MRLADALQARFIFMMDDSVRAWRGVTLAEDTHSMFGLAPGKKAQFTNVSLAQVLEHFADQNFLEQELPKFSALGFGRFAPELYTAKCAYRRGHIYSAFLLNVRKVLHEQGVNFNPNLFVWEDLDFNLRANDICKCFRFVMIKKPYTSGGCTEHIARTENPHVRAGMLAKLSPAEIASEALGAESGGSAVTESAIVVSKRSKRKSSLAIVESADPAADAAAAAELLRRSVYELENDPSLKPEGAICDEKGLLLRSYYKKFREAFKDKERRCTELKTGTVNRRPGMRNGEEWPTGLRFWDDTMDGSKTKRTYKKKSTGETTQAWGAGWVAANPFPRKKREGDAESLPSTPAGSWFNISVWETWRLAFVLARLQREVWIAQAVAKGLELPKTDGARVKGKTMQRRTFRRKAAGLKRKGAATTPLKRKKQKGEHGSAQKMLAICDRPGGASSSQQPTLRNFFGSDSKKAEQTEAPEAPQPTLMMFWKTSQAKQASDVGAASSSSRTS
jgi:hypothetical protein